ncbi:MAG: hypothetical protein JOZ58_12420 [Acetobacteraceae bacterium]|nr:hypothetical protein [Acetobacteraceae bacterium]
MAESMSDKLRRRKLDALKRGVHRTGGGEALPVSIHVVGIGKAGAGVLAETLRGLEPGAPRLCALAVDIGGQDVAGLRAVSANLPAERAEVTIVALDVPKREALLDTLRRYPEFLTLEYPHYRWKADFAPWLAPSVELPGTGDHIRRAVAKAIYGAAYYGAPRALHRALRDFAAGVDAARSQAVVAVVFGLGGGTGSGIAVDLARHLSNGIFGHRVLVVGIGIAPCGGDPPEHAGGHLFAALNELDCLGDEGKNRGVVASCGELFRNPFTAGFIVVPQQQAWESTRDLAVTQSRGNHEIASLLTARAGTNLWEMLRLLNWVAAPSTQHSAARTPWGPRWIHLLGFADTPNGPIAVGPSLPRQLGLLPGYAPEFLEARVSDGVRASTLADELAAALAPEVPPQIVGGGRSGSVQFVLPSLRKTDLDVFHAARAAYDSEDQGRRLLDHSLLLDQGVVLSEPSTRLDGMAGASLAGGKGWVAVPFADLRGGEEPLRGTDAAVPKTRELGHAL